MKKQSDTTDKLRECLVKCISSEVDIGPNARKLVLDTVKPFDGPHTAERDYRWLLDGIHLAREVEAQNFIGVPV